MWQSPTDDTILEHIEHRISELASLVIVARYEFEVFGRICRIDRLGLFYTSSEPTTCCIGTVPLIVGESSRVSDASSEIGLPGVICKFKIGRDTEDLVCFVEHRRHDTFCI